MDGTLAWSVGVTGDPSLCAGQGGVAGIPVDPGSARKMCNKIIFKPLCVAFVNYFSGLLSYKERERVSIGDL